MIINKCKVNLYINLLIELFCSGTKKFKPTIMLIMFIIYVIKKNLKSYHSWEMITEVFKRLVFRMKYVLPFFLIASTSSDNKEVEIKNMYFNVIKKESNIGFINVEKRSTNETTTYIINSKINAKVVFNFIAIGKEKSIYKSDTLIYSSVYRKLNSKVKLDQSLAYHSGKYILSNRNKKERLYFNVINRNLVTLYFFEPKGISEVYSDKYKTMLKIDTIGNGMYKIIFPDKSLNIYHYEYGRCIMIEVEGPFFKVSLIPDGKTKIIKESV